jgi:hypothetical protein
MSLSTADALIIYANLVDHILDLLIWNFDPHAFDGHLESWLLSQQESSAKADKPRCFHFLHYTGISIRHNCPSRPERW